MEYAHADPTYVAKTQVGVSLRDEHCSLSSEALQDSYEAYRRIKGDGQCGWRGECTCRSMLPYSQEIGTVFGYFEVLLKSGDLGLVLQEHTRIQSYSEMMKNVGMDYDLLVDMFDHTFDLLGEIRKTLEAGNGTESVLMEAFNDEIVSNSIVYHFKVSVIFQQQPC